MNEVLSRTEDKKLVKALQAAAYNDYPNPGRIGCPTDINILKALAAKKLHVTDPVIQHVAECSPCFREVMELRRQQKRLRLIKVLGGLAGVLLIIGIAAFRHSHPASSSDAKACRTAA